MKKMLALALALSMSAAVFTGCAVNPDKKAFDTTKEISVVSREDGSGTRSAFIELFGVQVTNAEGAKVDMTTKEAIIADKTDIMMTTVANDPYAIGYVSLGSLNDSVKALKIGGVEATVDNVKEGKYKIQRPFIIAYKEGLSELAQDFIDFIMSAEGQSIVNANKYIVIDEEAPAFTGGNASGKIVVAGSSSVTPLMEKLREAYLAINTDAAIEIQMSDSSAGMSSAISGVCDIGMASRELKDSEKEVLEDLVIALDGIAVIVNKTNTIDNLTSAEVKSIFTGEALIWNQVQ